MEIGCKRKCNSGKGGSLCLLVSLARRPSPPRCSS